MALGGLTVGNDRMDKIFNHFPIILDCMIPASERNEMVEGTPLAVIYEDTKQLHAILKNVLTSLRAKAPFDRAQCAELQGRIDKAAVLYTSLYGGNRVSNYFHLLFAGHIRDFLLECGSLYRFQAH